MSLKIALLGTFHSQFNGQPIEPLNNSPRLQALLAYLLLHRDAPHSRQQIAFQLWPVSGDSQARTNLRKLFLQLRRALPNEDQFLTFDNQTIGWRADAPCTCDLLQVQALLAAVDADPTDRAALTQLLDRYGGELLPDCYDEWVLPLRAELHQDVMAALTQLVTLLENQRAYDDGIRYAQQLLTLEPLAEQGYQQLMRLHAAEGDRAGALKVYQACVDTLAHELGVEPSAETQALYQRLRQAKSSAAHRAQPAPVPDLPPLIGRQTEWQTLRAAWQRAMTGRATVVTVAGEAGIGKTRLAEELLQWAEQQGIAAARTRSYQAQGALAYAPITDLLQVEPIYSRLPSLHENQLSHVARLLPKLLEEHPNLAPPQPMTEGWQRQQFFNALAQAIFATKQPLLLFFDDLQWADGETLSWLHFLLRTASSFPLLLVGTIRTGEIDDSHPLFPLLNTLRRDDLLNEITLFPLDAAEVAVLAQSLQSTALAAGEVAQLYADTEGNPLFVVESVRAQQGTTWASVAGANESGLPPKIYAVIRSRLTQLTPETQSLVNLAAVIGRSFSYDVLAAASAMVEEEVVDAIDELLARQIIREQRMDGYDFSHDRIRDVTYAEISQTRRRLLHRRVAQALELLYAEALETQWAVLADHHEKARNAVEAVGYWQKAGEQAAAQFANSAAVDYFSRALALVAKDEIRKRVELLLARERVYFYLARPEAQKADLDLLLSLAESFGTLSADDAAECRKLNALIQMRISKWSAAVGDYQAAVQFAEQAIQVAEDCGEHAIESDAFCGSGVIYFELGKLSTARDRLQQALAAARAAASPQRIAEALDWLSAVSMFTGAPFATIMGYLEEAMTIHQGNDDLYGERNIHHKMAYALIAQGEGEYARAIAHIHEGLALSRRLGTLVNDGQQLRNLGWLYVYTGDYNKAYAALQQSIDQLEGTNVTFAAAAHSYLGFHYLQSGDWENAQRWLMHALDGFRAVEETRPHRTLVLHWLSQLHLLREAYESALDYAQQAVRAAEPRGDSRHLATAHTLIGHALVGLEEYSVAAEHYQQAKELALALEQYNRHLEPMAGLADVALQRSEPAEALAIVEAILEHVETNTLDRTEEGLQVYRTCYRVLRANRDSRAQSILATMYDQLQARAATIDDPEQRRLFWEAMPGHREIRERFDP